MDPIDFSHNLNDEKKGGFNKDEKEGLFWIFYGYYFES